MKVMKFFVGIVVMLLVVVGTSSVTGNAKEQVTTTVEVEAKYYKDIQELKYPYVQLSNDESLQTKINETFTSYIGQSYQAYQKNQQQAEQQGFPADYQSDFEVKYNKNNKLSVLTSDYKFAGGAHGSTEVNSFNFDLVDEERVWLTDDLQTDKQTEQVTDYLVNYMSEHPNVFFPDLTKEDIQLGEETAFYFTDDGIAIVFQQYEVAPYVAGNQEVEVPSNIYQ